MKIITVLVLSILGSTLSSYAHCMWIETNPTGTKGQVQSARIYYGEYVENLHEQIDGNFKDLTNFTIWLVTPGKQRIPLSTQAGKDYFEVRFTPDQDGIYTLQLENTNIKLVDTKGMLGVLKPAFYATADVLVGKRGREDVDSVLSNTNPIGVGATPGVKKYTVNKPVQLYAFFNGKSLAKSTVTVFSPAGWSREMTTDEKGLVSLVPEWKGRYVIEIIHFDKTPGQVNGASYQVVRNVVTSNLMVD